jgi:predicted ester cyclase
MTDTGKDLVRRLYRELWSEGKPGCADEICAPGFVGHAPGHLEFQGAGALKELVASFREAFPDLEVALQSQFGEGDAVVTEHVMRGTHRGAFMGVPPTRKRLDFSGTSIAHVSGGEIVEIWYEWDRRRLLEQLGVMPEVV